MFIDKAKIFVKSGKGGNGCISLLRSKFIRFGGPDGGNGGKGGDIYVLGDRSINTLFSFKYKKIFTAENGQHGEGNNRKGKDGEDLFVLLPFGTEITMENGDIFEVLDDKPKLVLHGGKGGIGNGCLANSVNQVPRFSYPPGAAEEMFLNLKLKIIGDVGLIGLPNAGKSSFINSCTNANSLVGSYAFTTLEPKLGTYENLILVDIPGLIEGASGGKGLGFQFLSHVERCKKLLILADANHFPERAVKILLKELSSYGIVKKFVLVLNKIELLKAKQIREIKNNLKNEHPTSSVFCISVHKKIGIKNLLTFLQKD